MGYLILGSDWLRPVHHLPGRPFGVGPLDRCTIVGSLARNAIAIPNALLLSQIGDDPRTATYAQAWRAVGRRAALLADSGLARGERVGVLGHNSIDFVSPFWPCLKRAESPCLWIRNTHRRAPPRTSSSPNAASCCTTRIAPASLKDAPGERICSFQGDVMRIAGAPRDRATGADGRRTDLFHLWHDGRAKSRRAVPLRRCAKCLVAGRASSHRAGDRLPCALPLHHVNGLEFTVLAAMLGCGRTVICRGFDGLRFWTAVCERGIHIAQPGAEPAAAARASARACAGTADRCRCATPSRRRRRCRPRSHGACAKRPRACGPCRATACRKATNFLVPQCRRSCSSADHAAAGCWHGRRTSVGPAAARPARSPSGGGGGPADRRGRGRRNRHSRSLRHERLSSQRRGDGRGVPRRLVPHRRPRLLVCPTRGRTRILPRLRAGMREIAKRSGAMVKSCSSWTKCWRRCPAWLTRRRQRSRTLGR